MTTTAHKTGRHLVATGTGVILLPAAQQHRRAADPLEDARKLLAKWDAMSARDQNYMSKLYADVLASALRRLAASCEPLRDAVAGQVAEIVRRAVCGEGPAAALSAQERQRRLRVVKDG